MFKNKKKQLLALGTYASLSFSIAFAQKATPNWFNLDPQQDNLRGVSAEKAYKELLKDKKSTTIIVAVIDSGIEIDHPALKNKIWKNEKEINGKDGVDDDGNGYIDDKFGWDFIGGKDGKDVNQDTYELTREYVRLSPKYKDVDEKTAKDKKEFAYFQLVKDKFEKKRKEMQGGFDNVAPIYTMVKEGMEKVKKDLKKDKIVLQDVKSWTPTNDEDKQIKTTLVAVLGQYDLEQINGYYEYVENGLKYGLNPEFNPRTVVGDNYADGKEKGYGNNEVEGPDAEHGTHVAGIIAGERNAGLPMQGVAENVKIMTLRTVPNGDERDKDIANSIRYAVDNGARIINMSFGKEFSPQKQLVDEAVQYAEKKGVLLVHAAGNDSKNIDTERNFPTKKFLNGKLAKNWIEVGALDWGSGGKFLADFTNYGKKSIDIFAPGVDIYSAVPDAKYKDNSGTSMAAPVVAGVAALILSYYPQLKAQELREIIIKSSRKFPSEKVNKPGSETEKIELKELSIDAGLINVYGALVLAEKMAKKK
ncbi:MAG: peptidase S8 [Bacteroidetes bacterium]|nr:MAG: peptidase S8 [Bacteroidota bacterium]